MLYNPLSDLIILKKITDYITLNAPKKVLIWLVIKCIFITKSKKTPYLRCFDIFLIRIREAP